MYSTARSVGVIVISDGAGGRFGGRFGGRSWFGRNQRSDFGKVTEEKWGGRRESNPYYQLGNFIHRLFIFNIYKNRSGTMYVHALHNVHAVPDFACRCGTFVHDRISLPGKPNQ